MPTGLTNTQVVNETLQFIGSQYRITSLTDGSDAANLATVLYVPTVELMLRLMDPDFARTTAALALSAAPTPVPPWAYEYLWPTDMLRLRQVRPPNSGTGSLSDSNNPYPVKANVAFDTIATVVTKVILSNQQNALAVYTSSNVTEVQWDSAFEDSVVRRLANPMAMALDGRPDFARELLQESVQAASAAGMVDDSGFRRAPG